MPNLFEQLSKAVPWPSADGDTSQINESQEFTKESFRRASRLFEEEATVPDMEADGELAIAVGNLVQHPDIELQPIYEYTEESLSMAYKDTDVVGVVTTEQGQQVVYQAKRREFNTGSVDHDGRLIKVTPRVRRLLER